MPREFDLEAFVRSRMHLSRSGLIGELEREGDRLEKIARSKRSKAKRTPRGDQKLRLQNETWGARRNMERIGRILFFLRYGTPADDAADEDFALCKELADKLR
jgi:hypothetical protein